MNNAIQTSYLRLIGFIFFLFQLQSAICQSKESMNNFKITGKIRIQIPFYSEEVYERSVEYDKKSPDHVYITDFRKNGSICQKTQMLFKGKKFNLEKLSEYIRAKELLRDGVQNIFREDTSIASELIFKDDILRQQTTYFANGNKELSFLCNNEMLHGEMQMWYPDGHLSFTGNYKNNLKDGPFESFNQTGNPDRKGIYQEGKLISGVSVVQDLVYDKPDVPAQYIDGDVAFNNYLIMKTSGFGTIKEMVENDIRVINLRLTIDKTGLTKKMEILSELNPSDHDIINAIFKDFPGFKPALQEGAPVRSILNLNLLLSNKGVYLDRIFHIVQDSISNPDYFIVEEMPEYPGGQLALRKLIAQTIRYPVYAQENGIQGKVFVSFIIKEDGSIANITIAKSVHPILDAEAIRVVRQLPKWKPGKQKGKPVRVSYTVPIGFVLQ